MKQKLKVFFRRVSSANQDLATQIEFDRPYREQYDKEHILEVNEDDTSANKLRVIQRPKMTQIIQMIKEGKVEKLYAYDRTRLFRDFYEAQEFNQTCYENNVEIIFTSKSNGHMPHTDNHLIEGMHNLFGDIEGNNIKRRTTENQKKFPPRKFGYLKTKQKKYQKCPEKKPCLEQFFEEIQMIGTQELFIRFLSKYRKLLGKDDDTLIRIATDPFYAGYDLHGGEYSLSHVDTFLTKEIFMETQRRLLPLISDYESKKQRLREMYTVVPKCGYCLKELTPRFNGDRTAFYFSCSKGHPKVRHDTFSINEAARHLVHKTAEHLNIDRLLADSLKRMKQIKRLIKLELDRTEFSLKEAENAILFSDDKYEEDWHKKKNYKDVLSLQKLYRSYEEEVNKKQQLLIENQQLQQLTIQSIESQAELNIKPLCGLLINEVRLYEQSIDFDVNKCDYIMNLDTETVLNLKEIL